jgi:FSR family fosmidomycin resistance protein-like MFS transporter
LSNKLNKGAVAVLALGHGVTDMYANFLPALLPFFQDKFGLSKTLIGGLIFGMSTSGSLFQVLFGYLGDKWNSRLFLVPGPAIAAIFMCFVGISPSFAILFILLILGGIGVSSFHPHAASFTGSMAGEKRGFGLSIFMTGGTIGYAAGPLVAAALASSYIGSGKMPLASIFGILMSILLYKYAISPEDQSKQRRSVNILKIMRPHLKPLSCLTILVILKAVVSIVFVNFTSLLMNQRGWSILAGGSLISLFTICSAVGTIIGGYFYDRFSKKKLLIYSLIFSSPFLFGMVHLSGFTFFLFLVMSGILMGYSNTMPLALAQELIPEGAGTVSSIMMGLSWGLAGVFAWGFGMLADSFGGDVAPAMSIAAFLPILAAMFAIPLPGK